MTMKGMHCHRCMKETDDCSLEEEGPVVLEIVEKGCPCKAAVVCWSCFEEIDPDLWIDKAIWTKHMPAVSYENLPIYDHKAANRNDPRSYDSSYTKEQKE